MRKEPRSLRFWRWVHEYSEEKIKSTWMDIHRHDRICPNCKTWNSVIGEWPEEIPNTPDVWHDTSKCHKCGHFTVWNMTGMLPYVDDCYPPPKETSGDNNDSISPINS